MSLMPRVGGKEGWELAFKGCEGVLCTKLSSSLHPDSSTLLVHCYHHCWKFWGPCIMLVPVSSLSDDKWNTSYCFVVIDKLVRIRVFVQMKLQLRERWASHILFVTWRWLGEVAAMWQGGNGQLTRLVAVCPDLNSVGALGNMYSIFGITIIQQ